MTSSVLYSLSISGNGRVGFFTGAQIYSAPGVRTVWVKRSHGTSGSVTVDYTITAGRNATISGTTSGTLTWSSGQGGFQAIDVTVGSPIAGGSSHTHVTLSNVTGSASLDCREYEIITDDGSVPAVLDSIYISPSGNDTTGLGTVLLPYATLKKAITALSSTKWRIVCRGGTYDILNESTVSNSVTQHVAILPAPSGGLQVSNITRVVISKYPGETPYFTCSSGECSGIYAWADGSITPSGTGNYVTIYGLEVGNITLTSQDGGGFTLYYCNNTHVIGCHSHNVVGAASPGTNTGLIESFHSYDMIFACNRLHDVSGVTNENNSGIFIGWTTRCMSSNNVIYNVSTTHHHKFGATSSDPYTNADLDCFFNDTCSLHYNSLSDDFCFKPGSANTSVSGNIYIAGNVVLGTRGVYGYGSDTHDNWCFEHNYFQGKIESDGPLTNTTFLGNIWSGYIGYQNATYSVKKNDYQLLTKTSGQYQKAYVDVNPPFTSIASSIETNSLTAVSPTFVDSSNSTIEGRNYRLASGNGVGVSHDSKDMGPYFLPNQTVGLETLSGTDSSVGVVGTGLTVSRGTISLNVGSSTPLTGTSITISRGSVLPSVSANSSANLLTSLVTINKGNLTINSGIQATFSKNWDISNWDLEINSNTSIAAYAITGHSIASVAGVPNERWDNTGFSIGIGMGSVMPLNGFEVNLSGFPITLSRGSVSLSIQSPITLPTNVISVGFGTLSTEVPSNITLPIQGYSISVSSGQAQPTIGSVYRTPHFVEYVLAILFHEDLNWDFFGTRWDSNKHWDSTHL